MPASQDGLLAPSSPPYPQLTLPVSVTIQGVPAQVIYAGAAPGLVAGVMQINVVVPAGVLHQPYNEVAVTVGGYTSPTAVTLSVQ